MIFTWLEKRRRQKQAAAELQNAWNLLVTMGDLIVDHPTAYLDVDWLPAQKARMKSALKIAMLGTSDPKRMEWLKVGWTMLSYFQRGIGERPLTLEIAKELKATNWGSIDLWLVMSKKAERDLADDMLACTRF